MCSRLHSGSKTELAHRSVGMLSNTCGAWCVVRGTWCVVRSGWRGRHSRAGGLCVGSVWGVGSVGGVGGVGGVGRGTSLPR